MSRRDNIDPTQHAPIAVPSDLAGSGQGRGRGVKRTTKVCAAERCADLGTTGQNGGGLKGQQAAEPTAERRVTSRSRGGADATEQSVRGGLGGAQVAVRR
jgi:hypothetical protein